MTLNELWEGLRRRQPDIDLAMVEEVRAFASAHMHGPHALGAPCWGVVGADSQGYYMDMAEGHWGCHGIGAAPYSARHPALPSARDR